MENALKQPNAILVTTDYRRSHDAEIKVPYTLTREMTIGEVLDKLFTKPFDCLEIRLLSALPE